MRAPRRQQRILRSRCHQIISAGPVARWRSCTGLTHHDQARSCLPVRRVPGTRAGVEADPMECQVVMRGFVLLDVVHNAAPRSPAVAPGIASSLCRRERALEDHVAGDHVPYCAGGQQGVGNGVRGVKVVSSECVDPGPRSGLPAAWLPPLWKWSLEQETEVRWRQRRSREPARVRSMACADRRDHPQPVPMRTSRSEYTPRWKALVPAEAVAGQRALAS